MPERRPPRFVSDGCQRARLALEAENRAAVEREFAERLRDASLPRRLMLERQMAREIERRLGEQAPLDALY
jgi:hypothetical protein